MLGHDVENHDEINIRNNLNMTSPMNAMRDLLAEDQRFKLEGYQFIREYSTLTKILPAK